MQLKVYKRERVCAKRTVQMYRLFALQFIHIGGSAIWPSAMEIVWTDSAGGSVEVMYGLGSREQDGSLGSFTMRWG